MFSAHNEGCHHVPDQLRGSLLNIHVNGIEDIDVVKVLNLNHEPKELIQTRRGDGEVPKHFPRLGLAAGLLIQAASGWWMAQLDLNMTSGDVFWSNVMQGFGFGLAFGVGSGAGSAASGGGAFLILVAIMVNS